MTISVRPVPKQQIRVTAARAAVPVSVKAAASPPMQVRIIFAGPPGKNGKSGLDADAPVDLAGWYHLQKEM